LRTAPRGRGGDLVIKRLIVSQIAFLAPTAWV
jgi:hypothetical protein